MTGKKEKKTIEQSRVRDGTELCSYVIAVVNCFVSVSIGSICHLMQRMKNFGRNFALLLRTQKDLRALTDDFKVDL